MLQNADVLAKIGFDTAENEPAKILINFDEFCRARRPPPGGAAGGPEGRGLVQAPPGKAGHPEAWQSAS